MNSIITSLLIGFLNMTRGRGLSDKGGIYQIYSKAGFLALCVLVISLSYPVAIALYFVVGAMCLFWMGTGEMMLAIFNNKYRVNDFKSFWFARFWQRAFGEITTIADMRRVATWFTAFAALAFAPALLMQAAFMGSWWCLAKISLLPLYGLVIASCRYIQNNQWVWAELLGFTYLSLVYLV